VDHVTELVIGWPTE